ncbi:MAG: sugar ABC transporter permease [Clostridiales bacterium]|nr:sugar ABC transporter permease [Clostridiales bacterium]MDU3241224.1 sugar ABC transporter permease [Clostridiales bacterium]
MKTYKRIKRKGKRKEILAGYLMILPLMAGVAVFFIGAFFQNIYYSFTNKSSFGVPEFIGLQNYIQLFQDADFYRALLNTLLYVVICVPLVVVLSVLLAVLLNTKVKGIGLYRVCLFLPAVTLPAAIGLLWKWLLNYKFGLINEILGAVGIGPVAWLSDSGVVLISISVVFIWASVAYQVIILLAGLQGIPGCYQEAARIDGANGVKRFLKITLPLLSPSIFFVCVTTMINVFQIFDFIYLMIPQGSSGTEASRSLVTYFFEQSFVKFHKGYGAAVSLMLFLLILVITAIQLVCQKKMVFYDD